MGDTGSQFLGILLATFGILYLWNQPDKYGRLIPSKQFLVSIIVFIIPIVDTTTVFINRLLKHSSPFIGGRDHTTHHLSYMGLSDRQVAYLYILISLISMIVMTIIYYITNWTYIWTFVFILYFLLIFTGLFKVTHMKNRSN
jgi:UDP-GlcNAc:undecaprenyl-phosphate GlcNAc-1-phosphate transferase